MSKSDELLKVGDLKEGAVVVEAGNISEYRTGDWRSERPVLDRDKCNSCGMCYVYCPEGCRRPDDEEKFEADLFYCKGCGVCAHECPQKAITMIVEEEV